MKIRCLNVKGIKSSYLRAIADVEIEDYGLTIKGVKLFQKNDSYWASLPTKEYMSNGEKKYMSLLHFNPKEKEKEILNLIKDAILIELNTGENLDMMNRLNADDQDVFNF